MGCRRGGGAGAALLIEGIGWYPFPNLDGLTHTRTIAVLWRFSRLIMDSGTMSYGRLPRAAWELSMRRSNGALMDSGSG